MNNSVSLEDVSIMYTHILLLMWHLNTQQTNSQCWKCSEGDITMYSVKWGT